MGIIILERAEDKIGNINMLEEVLAVYGKRKSVF